MEAEYAEYAISFLGTGKGAEHAVVILDEIYAIFFLGAGMVAENAIISWGMLAEYALISSERSRDCCCTGCEYRSFIDEYAIFFSSFCTCCIFSFFA